MRFVPTEHLDAGNAGSQHFNNIASWDTAWRRRISSACWGRGAGGVEGIDPPLRGTTQPVRSGAGSRGAAD